MNVRERLRRLLKVLVYRVATWDVHRGLRISANHLDKHLQSDAISRIKRSLDLIAQYWPMQLARSQALVESIIVFPSATSSASWRKDLSACLIDTSWIASDEAYPEAIASVLIHELTHARLDALGFKYGDATRARIERICTRAQQRVVQYLPESDIKTTLRERNDLSEALNLTGSSVRQLARTARELHLIRAADRLTPARWPALVEMRGGSDESIRRASGRVAPFNGLRGGYSCNADECAGSGIH